VGIPRNMSLAKQWSKNHHVQANRGGIEEGLERSSLWPIPPRNDLFLALISYPKQANRGRAKLGPGLGAKGGEGHRLTQLGLEESY